MADVLIPKGYVRCVVAEDQHGRWYTEVFVNVKARTYFLKVNRSEGSLVMGPLNRDDLDWLAVALSDVKWASRNGFANVIPDRAEEVSES